MRKLIPSLILAFILLCMNTYTSAQLAATVKQGPSGIFVYAGKEIPAGKNIVSYKIERSGDNLRWEQLAELKTPSGFDAFAKAVENAKAFFPSQPLPPTDKLNQLYKKAMATGNTDSLKGMRLLFPIRVALGIMYYDTTASKNIPYRYRITGIKPAGEPAQSLLSDTVSLPFQPKFDTIRYSESSLNPGTVMIKWKSAGKNPAPLFMVYKFRFGAAAVAHGTTSRFEVNDTTYYMYSDTAISREAGKEMQFFVSPYDHYGNSGLSSQVAVITQDGFNKAAFVKNHTSFVGPLSGVQVCWHFTDPFTVKRYEIYRSETAEAGFRKIAEAASIDTAYLDEQIWPEKTYYYMVQPVAKAGKRTRQSDIMSAKVPGMVIAEKPKAPMLRQVAMVNGHIRLLVEVNDTLSTDIRVFRGVKGGLAALPGGLVRTQNASVVAFTDSTLPVKERKDVFYAVRNERAGVGISSLSDEMPIAMNANPEEVSYFYAFPSKGKTELYWDAVADEKSRYSSYTLARQNGPANSKSPLNILAEHLTQSSFTDNTAQSGNVYTYVLRLADKKGGFSDKTWKVSTRSVE